MFVKRTANIVLSLIKFSLALHSDFNVKMVYNKSDVYYTLRSVI